MEDREVVELIRRGASGWRGPGGEPSSALYARAQGGRRWRYGAAFAGAAAAVVLALMALAGGPGPVIANFAGVMNQSDQTQPSPDTHQASPTEPSPAAEPSPSPRVEPTPDKTDAKPAAGHEPTPSPEPRHTPPTEPTPPSSGDGSGTPTPGNH